MKRTNGGAQWWSEDKSFYAVLLLCLAAIAVAAYLLFAFPSSDAEETMQAQEYQADDTVKAAEAQERIPAMQPQPAQKQQESETQTDTAEQTKQPAEQSAADTAVTPPMDSKITQDFSNETLTYNETTGDWRTHEAIDYAGKAGDAVHAAADGTVLAVGNDAVLGTYLTISHARGMTSLYAGVAEPAVSEGDSVTRGQQIAVLGEPMPLEEKQGVHLHFAVSVDEVQKNPAELY